MPKSTSFKNLPPFVDSVESYNNLHIIRLRGELGAPVVPQFGEFLKEAKKESKLLGKDLLIDFKDVGAVDSATVAQLLTMLSELRHKKRKLALVNISSKLRKTLEVLRLDELFVICESEREAFREILRWSDDWT